MKIKVTQIKDAERNAIAQALYEYANTFKPVYSEIVIRYQHLSTRIRHGELILCEYQYNEQEKGGEHETGH